MRDFPLDPSKEYRGWAYVEVIRLAEMLQHARAAGVPLPDTPLPSSHIAVFKRRNGEIAEEVHIYNGQGPGPKFCMLNGLIHPCPPELADFATATYSGVVDVSEQ